MEVNYFGVVALTKALLPAMIDRNTGHFVVVSSVVGYVGTPYRSAYAASKHALHGWFESLRAEVHSNGIAVTMVCPGFVDTDIAQKAVAAAGGTPEEQAAHRKRAKDHGMTPDACAKIVERGMRKRAREVYVGGKELLSIYLRRYAPGVLATALRHVKTV
jgi:short-subunit dehydrogenase